jgi:hypothetical protein
LKFWELLVDDHSSKSDLKGKLIELLDELKDLKNIVKFQRLGNAGDKLHLRRLVHHNILVQNLNLEGQQLYKETDRWRESVNPFTEESV